MSEWDTSLERPMSDFGEMYDGYYMDTDDVRIVGFAWVLPEYQGNGYFKELSEKFKNGVRKVVIISPSIKSIELLQTQGYKYFSEEHICVWERNE